MDSGPGLAWHATGISVIIMPCRANGYFIYSTVEGVSFQPRNVPTGPLEVKLVRLWCGFAWATHIRPVCSRMVTLCDWHYGEAACSCGAVRSMGCKQQHVQVLRGLLLG